jgi:tRNA threonylcarbamoyladenosine biosynthesis protein TsaB
MNILAFDTSTAACSVALFSRDSILSEHVIQPRGHANLILSMIEILLNKAKINLAEVNLISFGQGPGSFTGLRIAAGVCQGIAYSHDIPIIALSSLRILAQGAYRKFSENNIAVLQDARMSEIYWGCYIENNGIMKLSGVEDVTKPEMIQLANNKNWYSVGEAWLSYPDKLVLGKDVIINKEFNYPNAIDMIALAKNEYDNGNCISVEQVNPVYIRNKVATVKK